MISWRNAAELSRCTRREPAPKCRRFRRFGARSAPVNRSPLAAEGHECRVRS